MSRSALRSSAGDESTGSRSCIRRGKFQDAAVLESSQFSLSWWIRLPPSLNEGCQHDAKLMVTLMTVGEMMGVSGRSRRGVQDAAMRGAVESAALSK